jgi:hypothetical protein
MKIYAVETWRFSWRNGGLVPVVSELETSPELLARLPGMFRAGAVRIARSGRALIIDRRKAGELAYGL